MADLRRETLRGQEKHFVSLAPCLQALRLIQTLPWEHMDEDSGEASQAEAEVLGLGTGSAVAVRTQALVGGHRPGSLAAHSFGQNVCFLGPLVVIETAVKLPSGERSARSRF